MMCSTEAQSVMHIDKAERKALPSSLSAQPHSYAMCIMEMTEEYSNVSCCPEKNLHWPQNKRIGFLFDTKYSQTHQNFQFMQATGEVVKVPEFLSTTYDDKLPMYTIFC